MVIRHEAVVLTKTIKARMDGKHGGLVVFGNACVMTYETALASHTLELGILWAFSVGTKLHFQST